jgi:hypothetical protein
MGKREYPFFVGAFVEALMDVTEDGGIHSAVLARKGELGTVVGIDHGEDSRGVPTVRFHRSLQATIVAKDEVKFVV